MLRIDSTSVSIPRTRRVLAELRDGFARQHYLRLPGLLSPALLRLVCEEVERSEFYELSHDGIGPNKELCMRNASVAGGLLHVLLNGDDLFEAIEKITGCGPIGCFRGRVYRVMPGHGHTDAWHADVADHRLVSLSINLSRRPYEGGMLQIRSLRSRRMLRQVPNTGFGDGILFRISPRLEHRITDIEGGTAKTAFAGWFQAEPRFLSLVTRSVGADEPR